MGLTTILKFGTWSSRFMIDYDVITNVITIRSTDLFVFTGITKELEKKLL